MELKFTWIKDGTEYWIHLDNYSPRGHDIRIREIRDMETSEDVTFDWMYVSGKLNERIETILDLALCHYVMEHTVIEIGHDL